MKPINKRKKITTNICWAVNFISAIFILGLFTSFDIDKINIYQLFTLTLLPVSAISLSVYILTLYPKKRRFK